MQAALAGSAAASLAVQDHDLGVGNRRFSCPPKGGVCYKDAVTGLSRCSGLQHGQRSSRFCTAVAAPDHGVLVDLQEGSKAVAPVTHVLVNGLGKMGMAVAEAVDAADGLELVPFSLSIEGETTRRVGNVDLKLYDISRKDSVLEDVARRYENVVVVDYTQPSSVNENAEAYCKWKLPFVMGTTGGDTAKLLETAAAAGVYAVIAPNMGKQVVAFQAALDILGEQFPGAFSGYKLEVTESHPSSKKDTSGTAKAVVASLNKAGCDFEVSQIHKVRDKAGQLEMGVPEEYINGHAFHTYKLLSPNGLVSFQFQHNVCGRAIYAEGTVDAVHFLAKKVQERAEKKLYNMIDVLREGNMR